MINWRRFVLLSAMSLGVGACTCEGPDSSAPSDEGSPDVEVPSEVASAERGIDEQQGGGSEYEDRDTAPGDLGQSGGERPDYDYTYDPTAPEIAAAHCQSCHVLPAASDHRKQDWPIVMGHMAYWMGIADDELPSIASRLPADEYAQIASRRDHLVDLGGIAAEPLMNASTWVQILDAYLEMAPETLPNPAATIQYQQREGVIVEDIGTGALNGMVISALKVDPASRRLLVGETSFSQAGLSGMVYEWRPTESFTRNVSFDNAPTALESWGDALLVTNIGDLFPSNEDNGSLWRVAGESWEKELVLSDIPRTPHALVLSSGELLISSFGHEIGRLWVAGRQEDGTLKESTVLVPSPGASESIAADIDGDGSDEYLVLFGQALDGVWVVERSDEGGWSAKPAIQRSPAFGHSDLSVADIDGDGDVDLLVANGDNLDLPNNPPRPYHGVRIYENDGSGNFSESFFFPMHGAYGVEAGNFDDDPELEIAAVAYFLQPQTESQSFVILDRDAEGEWKPFGAETVTGGQFCRIAVGNIDDSATDEIFLGGCYRQPPGPEAPRLVEVSFDAASSSR